MPLSSQKVLTCPGLLGLKASLALPKLGCFKPYLGYFQGPSPPTHFGDGSGGKTIGDARLPECGAAHRPSPAAHGAAIVPAQRRGKAALV